jgi:HEAT repeat protein
MQPTEHEEIRALTARLAGERGTDRVRARDELVELGDAAVPALLDAVRDGGPQLRREALKALQLIGAADAQPTFFHALQDDDPSCRWLAAEGLVGLGQPVLRPALELLVDGKPDERLERGLHHVLFELGHHDHGNLLAPVLEAFHGDTPAVRVPLAAHRALLELQDAGRRG